MKKLIKNYMTEFKIGIKTMFKEFFNPKTNKKQRANMWSFSRLIIPFIVIISTILGSNIISALLILFGELTDFIDGKSAKKHNSYSEFGKKFDQFTDKFMSVVIAIIISIINPIFISIIINEGIIAIINLGFKYKHPNCNDKSCLIGRIKQWPLSITLVLGLLASANPIINIILKSLLATTLVLQTATAIKYTKTHLNTIKLEKEQKSNISFDNNIENQSNNIEKITNTKNIDLSKKEKYIQLRDLLINIKEKKEEQVSIEKQKKLV